MRWILPCVLMFAATPALAGRFVFEEGEEIVGEIQKPEVELAIARANLNKAYDFDLKESFLPKIIEALSEAPF
ncbi:MAG: hypothetical protein JXX28_13370 [Deltaproteobacteria bacterium]|nr:hypothetical protein [Deltaproteobacteria bacterium]